MKERTYQIIFPKKAIYFFLLKKLRKYSIIGTCTKILTHYEGTVCYFKKKKKKTPILQN
jgi:hypothetical protein